MTKPTEREYKAALEAALEAAIISAINTVGLENFKKCSFFGSNDKPKN